MNAISHREEAAPSLTFADIERLGDHIAKSNLFGMKTKEQAIVLMAIAQAEGRHPVLAARDYDIIQGRPAKKAEAMLRDFIEGGGKVQWHELDDATADATFSHPAGGSVRINWNMERAAKAGLVTKDNYKKFPRQMLRSRTVSEGVRTVYPLATSGMYVPEEAADIGPTIEGTAEPAPAPKPRREKVAPVIEAAPEPTPTTWLEKYTAALEGERSLTAWIITFEDACATSSNEQDLVRLMGLDIVKRALAKGSQEIKDRITKASSAAFKRLTPPAAPASQPGLGLDAEPWRDETPVVIEGADRLMSG